MIFIVGILVFCFILTISIALHEAGHMLPAKAFGVRASEYFIGFGKKVWSKQVGDTEMGLKMLPFGGYCRLNGMYSPQRHKHASKKGWIYNLSQPARDESVTDDKKDGKKKSFYTLSVPKKLVVLLGGPFMNFVLAIVFMAIVFSAIGISQPSLVVNTVSVCEKSDANCSNVAYRAGLRDGDKIVSANGQNLQNWTDFTNIISGASGSIDISYMRNGQIINSVLTPKKVTVDNQTRNMIGVVSNLHREHAGITVLPKYIGTQLGATISLYAHLPVEIAKSVYNAVLSKPRGANSLMSVVGIAKISGDVGEAAASSNESTLSKFADMFGSWLMLGASLNLALGLFNLIPLVPLDGGQALGAIWEGIRRLFVRLRNKKTTFYADLARTVPLSYVVWFLFIGLSAVLIWADLFNPIKY
jgi:membrane-associated protease RseP (regulator of RpoE activity)